MATATALACGPLADDASVGDTPDSPDSGTPSVDCGDRRAWDSDGDGLSDRVEQNNGNNGYADLRVDRCDVDPSVAMGAPNQGSLAKGLNLPDRGTGYHHFYGSDAVDTDDWGIGALLRCFEATGRALSSSGIPVQVGDMSLRGGGTFPPHVAHQNGLEGDLRYIRNDRAEAPLDLRIDPDAYDADATAELFDTLFDACAIDFILVDLDRLGFTLDDASRQQRIVDSDGHSNHFHVRIRNNAL